jgi:predicted ATPase
MIKSLKFKDNYDLPLERENQKRFEIITHQPTEYTREKKPWKTFVLFKNDFQIEFNAGVNIIVGENGSGKSTLLSLIKSTLKNEDNNYLVLTGDTTSKTAIFFDGEEDNPITAIPKMINPASNNFVGLSAQLWFAQEESHGESMLPVLDYILDNAKGGYSIFMDEPETALSLRNQIRLVNKIKQSAGEYKNQLFLCTHSLAIINEFETIYDMETRQWVDRRAYVSKVINVI